MQGAGFLLLTNIIFLTVAMLATAIIRLIGLNDPMFALMTSALVASVFSGGMGAMWRRFRRPATPERWVKLSISVVVSFTAVVFSLAHQAISGVLTSPGITILLVAVECFLLAFVIATGVGTILNAAGWPSNPSDADQITATERPRD